MRAVELTDVVREPAPGRGVLGVTLAVDAGECLAVLGRNGSGKTTLTRLLLGLERPDRGRVRVLGAGPGPAGGRVGACLDAPAHWETLSGWDNAYFATRSAGLGHGEATAGLHGLFERAGLESHARDPVSAWSYGMRRKLALVAALAPDPELLVLDEPTAGVDEPFRAELAALIGARCNEGRVTWVAGNDPEWVEGLAGRVVLLEGGRVAVAGTVAGLVGESSALRQVELALAAGVPVPVPDLPGIRSFVQEGALLRCTVDPDPLLVPEFLAHVVRSGGDPAGLEIRRPGLRDLLRLGLGTGP